MALKNNNEESLRMKTTFEISQNVYLKIQEG